LNLNQEVFKAFHTNFDKVARYSKLYHIGVISPNSSIATAQETQATSEATSSSDVEDEATLVKKELEMRKDFEEIRRVVTDMGLFESNRTFFLLQAIQIVFCHVTSYYLLWNYGASPIPLTCAFILQVIAQVIMRNAKQEFSS
jgi:hypothetical protein